MDLIGHSYSHTVLICNVDVRDMRSHGSPDPHYVRFCET